MSIWSPYLIIKWVLVNAWVLPSSPIKIYTSYFQDITMLWFMLKRGKCTVFWIDKHVSVWITLVINRNSYMLDPCVKKALRFIVLNCTEFLISIALLGALWRTDQWRKDGQDVKYDKLLQLLFITSSFSTTSHYLPAFSPDLCHMVSCEIYSDIQPDIFIICIYI